MSFLSRFFQRKSRSELDEALDEVQEAPQPPFIKAKSAKSSAKSSSVDAVAVELVANEAGTVYVGFGLRWRTLVTSGGREAAQKMAQKAKATHFIFRSQQVGYGVLPSQANGELYPAAILAAKTHAGAAIFALTLGNGQYWFAVVRNGQPTNTDEVRSNLTDSEAVAQIRALTQQFDGEAFAIFTDIPNSGLEGKKDFTVHDIFDVVQTKNDQLEKIQVNKQRIPKPLLYAVLFAAVVLAGQFGYGRWKAYQIQKAREANQVVEESPETAWAPVLATFLRTTPKPNGTSVVEIRRSLSRLPVIWSGWSLTGARCQAAVELNAKKDRPWSCQCSYDRGRIADTSEQIQKKVKAYDPSFGVAFPSIVTMTISWSVNHHEQSLELTDLVEPMSTTIKVASLLQGFLPALSARPEFKMVPFELPPPKRQDGKPHPKPVSIPDLFKGDINLKGPLRSIDAVTQKLNYVEWDSVGLIADTKSDAAQKGLVASSLSVEANGKVFGKH